MNSKFTKSDLMDGDVCVLRNGDINIVNLNATMLMSRDGWNDMTDINDELEFKNDCFNIVKVYRPTQKYMCQFRKEVYTQGYLIYDRERQKK